MNDKKKCRYCDKPATIEMSIDQASTALCDEHWNAVVKKATGRNGHKAKPKRRGKS